MNIRAGSIGRIFAATVLALVLGACAGVPAAPAKASGGLLADPSGMTLYSFDRDVAGSGKSACNGPCAANWPAFSATTTATASGEWTIITRDDSSKQWAFRGRPLYTFAKDAKPGDRTGDGFNNAWRIARP